MSSLGEFSINLLCTLSGMAISLVFSWLTFRQRDKADTKAEAKSDGVLISDVGYIKAGVDDLKRDSRETHQTLEKYNERITRCEESCKQAHHRIDEIKGGE